MEWSTLVPLAIALALDAFAVAVATSGALGRVTGRQVFRLSFHFGLFQALMPLLGWAAGLTVAEYVAVWDHWIAFGLLTLIGGRAIVSALRQSGGADAAAQRGDPTRGLSLVALSTATSIDALAVGLTFSALGVTLLVPVLVIGATAAGLTLLGMFLGSRLGQRLGVKMELIGGLVLIGIGLKILIEHTA
jgi:putative Mn2+ efflux pump MntP